MLSQKDLETRMLETAQNGLVSFITTKLNTTNEIKSGTFLQIALVKRFKELLSVASVETDEKVKTIARAEEAGNHIAKTLIKSSKEFATSFDDKKVNDKLMTSISVAITNAIATLE